MGEFAASVYNAIKEVCGSEAQQTQWEYVTSESPYGMATADALEAVLLETTLEETDTTIDRLRTIIQSMGCLPFFHRTNILDGPRKRKVVVFQATSILNLAEVTCLTSAGANYDIDDETMLDTFSDWDRRFGLTFLEISDAYLRLRFHTVPENQKAFLKEIVTFCPTILEVTESKAEYQQIMRDLQESHILSLWWD